MNPGFRRIWIGSLAILVSGAVFVLPFSFVVLMAIKNKQEASLHDFSLPRQVNLLDNLIAVVSARDYMMWGALLNSTVLTVAGVTILVVFGALAGFVMERRSGLLSSLANYCVLAGLIIPPAVVPTIWVLQGIHLFKTMPGMILIEVAYGLSFCVLLFRAFAATIPRELDEAAIIDGAGPLRLFWIVALPLMRPVIITVVVVQSVAIFNDFVNPLYYLPGTKNAAIQVTLFNFQSMYSTSYNLLFMDILLITIPPLLVFLFFNRQLVAGLTAGAVKG
jgi:raffinose/stachyose/melibiose transport system permease protein